MVQHRIEDDWVLLLTSPPSPTVEYADAADRLASEERREWGGGCAGVERKYEGEGVDGVSDVDGVSKSSEGEWPSPDTIAENIEFQGQAKPQLDTAVQQDPELVPDSPRSLSSQRPVTEDDDDTPPHSPQRPSHSHKPLISTLPRTLRRATKASRSQPRSHSPSTPPFPNSQLSDWDPNKRFCTYREPVKTAYRTKRRLIACDEPGCRVRWFHKVCVGVEDGGGGGFVWGSELRLDNT